VKPTLAVSKEFNLRKEKFLFRFAIAAALADAARPTQRQCKQMMA